MGRPTWPIEEKIDRFSIWEPNSGCRIWLACRNGDEYGSVWFDGRMQGAHRVAYELAKGPIPEGLTIDHLCRNHPCINDAHLEPVTMRENGARGFGVGALNGRKTHCPQGHPYDDKNTLFVQGNRVCRACRAVWMPKAWRRYRAKRNALTSGNV